MSAFWGLGQLMFSKCIVVVDKDVNVQNEAEVAWIAGTHVDPSRDIEITTGPGGRSRRRGDVAGVRRQDGHRRHAQVAVGGRDARVPEAARDDRARRAGEGRRDLAKMADREADEPSATSL